MKTGTKAQKEKFRKEINDLLAGELQLRSKRELIEKFINENLPFIDDDDDDLGDAFDAFLDVKKEKVLVQLCTEEELSKEKVTRVIGEYLFTERKPLPDDIVQLLEVKTKILERKPIVERVTGKIMAFIETFIDGMGQMFNCRSSPYPEIHLCFPINVLI